uniref:Putative ovule protein n=1 Tax=Solanum chacoense TaxID=4108 RepID=A0A0V0H5K5_SOLCH
MGRIQARFYVYRTVYRVYSVHFTFPAPISAFQTCISLFFQCIHVYTLVYTVYTALFGGFWDLKVQFPALFKPSGTCISAFAG